jgi:hypothetical protein
MQMRRCVFLNDKTVFRGLQALRAAGLIGFLEVAFGGVAGQQFLDHSTLSIASWNGKPTAVLKFQLEESSTEGSYSCSRWKPDRSTACHEGSSGSMNRNGMAFVAS